MTSIISQSLQRWTELTAEGNSVSLRTTAEDLSELLTGPAIDEKAKLKEFGVVSVKLSTKRIGVAKQLVQDVLTCDGHIVDVPADGNCGFHAICRAAFPYGGKTFLDKNMPYSSQEGRSVLIDFITKHRQGIENVAVQAFGIVTASNYLWDDVRKRQGSGSHVSHTELCNNLQHEGLMGHWLGAAIGEAEIHLLGRALGVTVHCVMEAADGKGGSCLRQTICPYLSLWNGPLHGTPKGAVVIRFTGSYDCGHYQIVKSASGNVRVLPSPSLRGKKREARKRRREIDDEELERDVAAVDHMHGVQTQTKKRYFTDYVLVDIALQSLMKRGIGPLDLEYNGSQVVKSIQGVLLRRCGPREKGYENLSAKATGKVILAAVASWYKDHGKSFNESHTTVVSGNSVRGPPWKAQEVLEFKQSLLKIQAKSRTVLDRKAYQLTHDDIAAAMRYSVAQQLGVALDTSYAPGTNPNVNWMPLQVALMVVAAFGSGCRGAEMTSILLGDLKFLYEGADPTIGAILYGVKSKNGYRAIRRIVFLSWIDTSVISPTFAILTQIALVHGLGSRSGMHNLEAPLFSNIQRNQVLRGQRMPADTYNSALKELFRGLGITDNATEHSPRRGGSGFRYYVLGEFPNYIRDILGHARPRKQLCHARLWNLWNEENQMI